MKIEQLTAIVAGHINVSQQSVSLNNCLLSR
jgi:hypothetical protein